MPQHDVVFTAMGPKRQGSLVRWMDMVLAMGGILCAAVPVGFALLLVWVQDGSAPLYAGTRVGQHGKLFRIYKIRSMRINAEQSGVDSTTADDVRVTPVGAWLRRCKVDELPQLWNVLVGDMSMVGPRPNVPAEVALYSDVEKRLLTVRPGVTDLASIVFSDLGRILQGHGDPNLAYNQIIRPWKSRLALFAVEHASLGLYLQTIWMTVVSIPCRAWGLKGVAHALKRRGASEELITVALRKNTLHPMPPPGMDSIVLTRHTTPRLTRSW